MNNKDLVSSYKMIFSFVLSHSSRMVQIQIQMAERAVELLTLPEDQSSYVLDVGYDHFDTV